MTQRTPTDSADRPVSSPRSSTQFEVLYDRAVTDLLDVSVGEQWVDTHCGPTHILVAGDPEAPPLFVFQGGNVTNPVTLSWVQRLADEYYLVAPDTPGQPGLSPSQDPVEFGSWVVDVVDALGLDTVPMVGLSHGAGVVLEAAASAPDRIASAVLVVPAGFGTPLTGALARVVFPSLAYRLVPNRRLLWWALSAMFTDHLDSVPDVVVETIGLALRTNDIDADFPGPKRPDALRGFDAPTLVVTAENDPFFPGHETASRAATWLPSPVETVVLDGERHFLSMRGRETVTAQIRSFLSTE